jgi:hypothetical protein
MNVLALYDIHGNLDALKAVLSDPRADAAGRRMLAAGWPDQRSIDGGLIDPVDPMLATKLFEGVE